MDQDGRHGARCFIRRDRHHAAIRADALHPARRQQHALPGMRIAPRGTHRRAALGRERRAVGPDQRHLRTGQTPAMRIEPDRGRCSAVDRLLRVDGRATATVRFDAHGRRLAGAQVALVGPDGAPFAPESGTAVRATWRDAHTGQSVLLAPGRVQRVGPYGGVMTVAADEATGAVAPVLIHIRHP